METVLLETIEVYNDYLVKLPKGCAMIADLLRDDQISMAMDNIVNFTEGIQWLLQVTDLLEQHDIQTGIKSEEINGFLLEVNEAINNEDYYLAADIFEYELIDFTKQLQAVQIDQ